MLDQNMTTLLSTLLGGLLAIIGGFLAIYITQFMANKAEQRQLVREKIEEAYILVNEVIASNRSYASRITREKLEPLQIDWQFNEDFVNRTYVAMHKLLMLVDLYIPELKQDFKDFASSMSKYMNLASNIGVTGNITEMKDILSNMEEAHKNMSSSICKLIKKV